MISLRLTLGACALVLLAACGVEGPPSAPDRDGVTLRGEASFGVVGTF